MRGGPRQHLDALAAERDGDAIGVGEIRRHDERERAAVTSAPLNAPSRLASYSANWALMLPCASLLLDASVAVGVLRADILRQRRIGRRHRQALIIASWPMMRAVSAYTDAPDP